MPTLPTEHKTWTYQDYLEETEEGEIYEIIEGDLLMTSPSLTYAHQDISRDLEFLLWEYVKKKKGGKIYYAPIDVVLDDNNVVQPDILYISKENVGIIQEKGIVGIPDVIIEILSPSSIKRDRYEKRALYEKFKVKEYWIVDPANRSIEVLTLKGDEYELFSFVIQEGIVKSFVIEGFEIELSEIM